MLKQIIVFIALCGMVSCATRTRSPEHVIDLRNVRNDYFEIVSTQPSDVVLNPSAIKAGCPRLYQLLEQYDRAVNYLAYKRGKVHLLILNEQGQPLDGVKATVRNVWPSFFFEPRGTSKEIVVDKTVTLNWYGGPDSDVEIDLSKEGYRDTRVSFSNYENDDFRRLYHAQESLQIGYVLPPLLKDGPVRVVMPPACEWDPNTGDDRVTRVTDKTLWPKKIPDNATVLISSDHPKMMLAPIRGTYAICNRVGEVCEMVQLDRGNPFLFDLLPPGNEDRVSFYYLGQGGKLDARQAPYQWRLFSIAKPKIASLK